MQESKKTTRQVEERLNIINIVNVYWSNVTNVSIERCQMYAFDLTDVCVCLYGGRQVITQIKRQTHVRAYLHDNYCGS